MDTSTILPDQNKEMDAIILRQLDLLQDYCTLSLETEGVMSRGYLQIAKSRFVNGSNRISSAATIVPTSDIETDDPLDPISELDLVNDLAKAVFTVGKDDMKECVLVTPLSENEQKYKLGKLRQKVGGFLSSASLGIAQQQFMTVLQLCIERAQVHSEILKNYERYSELEILKLGQLTIQNPEP